MAHFKGTFLSFFKKKILFILIFTEREREGERGRETLMCERNIDSLPLTHPSLGPAWNPSLRPDWESNWLGFQHHAQSTEPHQSGEGKIFFYTNIELKILYKPTEIWFSIQNLTLVQTCLETMHINIEVRRSCKEHIFQDRLITSSLLSFTFHITLIAAREAAACTPTF